MVVSGSIDTIGMHRFRIYPKSPLVCLNLILKIQTLIEVVPTGSVHKGISIYHADRQLGSEFGIVGCLTPFYRSHMRLTDAYDAVIDPAAALIVHQLLLTIHLADDQKITILLRSQHRQLYGHGQFVYAFQIASQIAQVASPCFSQFAVAHTLALGNAKIGLARFGSIVSGLLVTLATALMQHI